MNKFFSKQIRNSKTAMIKFLENHFRYYTLNPWNQSTSYANNVKLPYLDLPDNIREKAYDFRCADCEPFNIEIESYIAQFREETGYDMGFNGRSNGYIILYDPSHPAQPLDQYTDFNELTLDEIKERVKLVQEFDRYCDLIRDTFIWYVEHAIINDETFTTTYTKRVARIPDED